MQANGAHDLVTRLAGEIDGAARCEPYTSQAADDRDHDDKPKKRKRKKRPLDAGDAPRRRRPHNAATRKFMLQPVPECRSESDLESGTGGAHAVSSSSSSADDEDEGMELDSATLAKEGTRDDEDMLTARFSHKTPQLRDDLSVRAVEEATAAANLSVAKAQAVLKPKDGKLARKKAGKKRKNQTKDQTMQRGTATHSDLPPQTRTVVRRTLPSVPKKPSGSAKTNRKVVIPIVYFFLLFFLFPSFLLALFDFLFDGLPSARANTVRVTPSTSPTA